MTCLKQNIGYPNTTTRIEIPIYAMVRRADPDFDRAHRFDLACTFDKDRRFVVDALKHGPYGAVAGLDLSPDFDVDAALVLGEQDAIRRGGDIGDPFGSDLDIGGLVPAVDPQQRTLGLAALDALIRFDNGFCDPLADDGTIITGRGASGRNPSTVPSLANIYSDLNADFASANCVHAVFYGGSRGNLSTDFGPNLGDGGLSSNLAAD